MKKASICLLVLVAVLAAMTISAIASEPSFYIISFDGNGVSISKDSQPKYPGQDLKLKDSYSFTRDKFFLGWATSPDAAEPEYQPGDIFTKDADTTLYCLWTNTVDLGEIDGKGTYNIEYPIEGRGAYVSFTPKQSGNYVIHSTGSYFKNTYSTPELTYGENYNTVGYAERNDGDYEMLAELTAGVKYYFQYYHVKNPFSLEISNEVYTITYSGTSIDPQVKYPGRDVKLTTSYTYSKDRFFLGWATSPDAAAAEYQPGDTFTIDADTILYAVWMNTVDLGEIDGKGTYNIEYPIEGRGAYVSFTPKQSGNYVIHSTGSYFKNTYSTPELSYGENYNSIGYAERNDGDYEMLAELTAGVKYYFQYYHVKNPFSLEISNEVYTITFYGSSIDSQVKYPGRDIKLTTSYSYSREHFFLGWATSPDAAAAEYQPGDTFTTDADTVLYAVWMDTVDLGEIDGKGTYNIEYPIEKRGAYVSFTPKQSGKYVIHSTGSYFENTYSTPELTYGENYNTVGYAERNDGDYEMLVELTAGVKYYFQYYHVKNPFPLEIVNQYSKEIQTADIKLPSSLTTILDDAFRGAAFRSVVIPESVMFVAPGAFAECSELEIVIVMGMETEIDADAFDANASIIIKAPENSKAEQFAAENGFEFSPLTD